MNADLSDLSGRRALVTGGGSGIGLATATMLDARGATVACLDLDPGKVPAPMLAIKADVADDAVTGVVADVVDQLGGLDILVNNAGVLVRGSVETVDLGAWRQMIDVNLLGTVRVSRAAVPALRESARADGHPAIVNTCSISALVGMPGAVAYASSKGAIYSLTLAMAADYVREGIRVNCVVAGPVDTPWVQRELAAAPDREAALAYVRARQPNGRLLTAEEIAASICHLASDLAGATTGTAMVVDGGLHGVRLPA